MHQRFFQICGGHQPLRVAVTGADGATATLALATPVIRIGSHPQADIAIPQAAPLQCLWVLIDGNLFHLPLTEGDEAAADWIRPDSIITVAESTLRALNPFQSAHDPASHPLDRDAGTPALQFEARGRFRSRKPLDVHPRLLVIGRDDGAKFKINHPSIHGLHAAILRTAAGPWIADLSRDGATFVNDAAVTAAPLRDGDRVTLGEVELLVRTATSSRNTSMTTTTGAAPLESAVGPILQQVAQFQQQTFEQFREMLGSMTNMFGAVLNEHRQFVKEEFARLERIGGTAAPAVSSTPVPQIAPAVPPPIPAYVPPPETVEHILPGAPGASAPPANAGMHLWVHEQIGNLEKQQTTRWQRILEKFKGN